MLNKKTLFNGVYAVALFSAISTCFGIFNELLNIMQLYDKEIVNLLNSYKNEDFFIPFFYFLLTFIVCAATVVILILSLTNKLDEKYARLPNVSIIASCAVTFILACTFIYLIQRYSAFADYYFIRSFDYTTLYTFRSLVMSYIASVGTILLCNIIQSKTENKVIANPADEETQE